MSDYNEIVSELNRMNGDKEILDNPTAQQLKDYYSRYKNSTYVKNGKQRKIFDGRSFVGQNINNIIRTQQKVDFQNDYNKFQQNKNQIPISKLQYYIDSNKTDPQMRKLYKDLLEQRQKEEQQNYGNLNKQSQKLEAQKQYFKDTHTQADTQKGKQEVQHKFNTKPDTFVIESNDEKQYLKSLQKGILSELLQQLGNCYELTIKYVQIDSEQQEENYTVKEKTFMVNSNTSDDVAQWIFNTEYGFVQYQSDQQDDQSGLVYHILSMTFNKIDQKTIEKHEKDEQIRALNKLFINTNYEDIVPNHVNYKKGRGHYFKYFTEQVSYDKIKSWGIDLDRYQIYPEQVNDQQKNDNQIHCFLFALQKAGIDQSTIDSLQLQLNSNFDLNINEIPKLQGRNFDLIILTKNSNNRTYHQELLQGDTIFLQEDEFDYKEDMQDDSIVKMCLYKDHYFIYENVSVTHWASNNFNQYKSLKNFSNKSSKYLKDKNLFKQSSDKSKSIPNIDFIDDLFNQGVFISTNKDFNQMDQKIKDITHIACIEECQRLLKTKQQLELEKLHSKQQRQLVILKSGYKTQQRKINRNKQLTNQDKDQQLVEALNNYNNQIIQLELQFNDQNDKLYNKQLKQQRTTIKSEIYHDKLIIVSDTEAVICDENLKYIKHKLYSLTYTSLYDTEKASKDHSLNHVKTSRNIPCMLKDLVNRAYDLNEKQVLLYYHNLDYDKQFFEDLKLQLDDLIISNGKWRSFSFQYKGIKFVLKDSLMIFQCKVKDLPERFLKGFNEEKEYFPYKYYSLKNIKSDKGSIQDSLQYINFDKDVKEEDKYNLFKESIIKAHALLDDEETYNMRQYCNYYCQIDTDIVARSLLQFRQDLIDTFGIDAVDKISISSISQQYQINQGCFDNVCQCCGLLREFLSYFVVGGRCMCANNKKYIYDKGYSQYKNITKDVFQNMNDYISDFDAVSLYPSAMKRVYYPAGKAQELTKEQIEYYNNPQNLFKITENIDSEDQNTLFVKVTLSEGKDFIKRMFPLVSSITEKNDSSSKQDEYGNTFNSKQFTNHNDLKKYYYVSHIVLQDLVNFQHYDYKIEYGIYYKERSYKIQSIISKMFQERLKFKNEGNPVEQIYKLILNSSYGKTIEKIHKYTQQQIKDAYVSEVSKIQRKQYTNLKEQNREKLCQLEEERNGSDIYIKYENSNKNQYNFEQVGVFILDMSKRIMNEVMCLSEDNNMNMFYQDTDSFRLFKKDLVKLQALYKLKYNRELVGTEQGQFHDDADKQKGYDYIGSCYGIYLTKKVYYDIVEYENKETHEHKCFPCIRFKGISEDAVKETAQRMFPQFKDDECQQIKQLYLHLYNGGFAIFNLAAGNRAIMNKNVNKKDGCGKFINQDNFYRIIRINTLNGNLEDQYGDIN